eukprot:gene16506-33187_t
MAAPAAAASGWQTMQRTDLATVAQVVERAIGPPPSLATTLQRIMAEVERRKLAAASSASGPAAVPARPPPPAPAAAQQSGKVQPPYLALRQCCHWLQGKCDFGDACNRPHADPTGPCQFG